MAEEPLTRIPHSYSTPLGDWVVGTVPTDTLYERLERLLSVQGPSPVSLSESDWLEPRLRAPGNPGYLRSVTKGGSAACRATSTIANLWIGYSKVELRQSG